MLEIRNLKKIYKPKKAVPVVALDGVSLRFPEKGMVFLLGKSGSGKSTLLNVLGGLDSFQEGEILVSGKSLSKFRPSQMDAYRNTFVGFIFQEYNVLEDFTVGANIALALELQGKKATDEEISAILKRVDLEGFGSRKPGELSGGQKQRVAIARALVKNPKIIMADEPTGALDSETGKQVLDTLKGLSQEKLVIVVSHDREFAQNYGDRIIELSDGKVISDLVYDQETYAFDEKGISYSDGEVTIPSGYQLSEEDREKINSYLLSLSEGKKLTLRREEKKRKGREISQEEVKISPVPFTLIPSRLPLKPAFRIGKAALGHKKFRLAFTIFLSVIAFGLFGLADTFGAYDHITTCVKSIKDSKISYASVQRQEKVSYQNGKKEAYYFTDGGNLKSEELSEIYEKTGVLMQGIVSPYGENLEFTRYYDNNAEFTKSEFHIYPFAFNGFATADEVVLKEMGMPLLCGRMPKGEKNEIVITSYICKTFQIGGFLKEGTENEYEKIQNDKDMLGKKISLCGKEYEVVGVLDDGFDLDRYRPLTEDKLGTSTADLILDYALYQELSGIREYSLCQVAFVSEETLEKIILNRSPYRPATGGSFTVEWVEKVKDEWKGFYAEFFGTLSDAKEDRILWVENEKTELEENEIIISLDVLLSSLPVEISGEVFGEDGFCPEYLTKEDLNALVSAVSELPDLTIFSFSFEDDQNTAKEIKDGKVVGILLSSGEGRNVGSVILANPDMLQDMIRLDDGIYSYAVGKMPEKTEDLKKLVSFSYDESASVRYPLQNSVCFELDGIHELLAAFSKGFFFAGIGFALFAALMLSNFISTSIIYKKQEIGILRAIGAGSRDVFRIFFAESFIVAMINFILSALGTFTVVTLLNYIVRRETGILVTILSFSIRQVVFLFALSLLASFAASFLPVKKIASKKPIDAIRGR